MTWKTDQMSEYGRDALASGQSFAENAKSTAEDLRSRASDALARGADWASKKTGDLDATSRELVGSMSEAARARPLFAVGIAIVAGFLLSQLLSRD